MKGRKINIVKDEIDKELDQIKTYEELAAKMRATILEQAIIEVPPKIKLKKG